MASPADQIAAIVPTTVLEGATGWKTKIGKMVADPDQVAVFYDTGGMPADPRWLLDYRSVMVQVRGAENDYSVTYTKGQEIRDSLLGLEPITLVSGDRIDGITMISELTFLHYDDKQRPLFSMNFRVFWEPATNSLTQREPL